MPVLFVTLFALFTVNTAQTNISPSNDTQIIANRIIQIMKNDPDSFDMGAAYERGPIKYACIDGFYSNELTELCNQLTALK